MRERWLLARRSRAALAAIGLSVSGVLMGCPVALPAAETAPTAAKAPSKSLLEKDVIRAWQKVEKDVVRAWEEAGATAGWMGEGEYGHLQYRFSYNCTLGDFRS